jgi:hypothetical protein
MRLLLQKHSKEYLSTLKPLTVKASFEKFGVNGESDLLNLLMLQKKKS